MSDYYTWHKTNPKAQQSLEFISNWLPEIINGKEVTIKWADLIELVNDEIGYPIVPTKKLDAKGITQQQREFFINNFSPIIKNIEVEDMLNFNEEI